MNGHPVGVLLANGQTMVMPAGTKIPLPQGAIVKTW